jgi:hypothetical protein
VLGYRGYDVGAAIATDLYGPPTNPLRFPSLPADEQEGSNPILTPKHALKVLAAGVLVVIAGTLVMGALKRKPRPTALSAARGRTVLESRLARFSTEERPLTKPRP